MLDAALEAIAEGGPAAATVAAIADRAGAPVGSIYHRFESRELLLARLWIRSIGRFQRGFLVALAGDDLDAAALAAALHGLDWARDHFDEARVLAFYRREDLAASWPRDLGDELATLNAEVEAALREHARRRYGQDGDAAVRRVTFALVDVPYAAGRRYLRAGTPPPRSADELVAETCRCVLGVVGGQADV